MTSEVNGPYIIIHVAVKLAEEIGGEGYPGWKLAYDWIVDKMMFGNDHVLPCNRCTTTLFGMLGDDMRIISKVMEDSVVGQ